MKILARQLITTGDSVTCADVQQGSLDGSLVDGDIVTLANVIVVSGVASDGKGFYVQDEGGGEWSGMYIYSETMVVILIPSLVTN